MKTIFSCMLSIIFIANTLVVSANVMPCIQDSDNYPLIELGVDANQPCHQEQSHETNETCKDACFCMHFTSNPIPIVESYSLTSIFSKNDHLSAANNQLISNIPTSIYRPPILFS